jgi:hypothetical protein
LNVEAVFPFSYTTTTDPLTGKTLTGKTDGRNLRCTASNTCPLVMNIDSGNEYWSRPAWSRCATCGTSARVSARAS